MKNKVVVVGSYNVDMTITTENLPKLGETVIGQSVNYGHGGKGANQAVAAARAGAQVQFLAKVGTDQYGTDAISCLTREGISSDFILQATDAPTGMAFITVNNQGENSIVVISGANGTLSAADVETQDNLFKDADILLTQLETPLDSVSAAIQSAKRNGTTVILNPAPAQPLASDLLKNVDIITPNRVEAEMLTGVTITDNSSLTSAADKLHSFGVVTVLITLGSEGVFVSSNGNQKLLQSIKVKAVDTVGAGDVFSGVLAARYSGVDNLEETVSIAIAAAGLSVTQIGAQAAIPLLSEVKAYLKEFALAESV